MAHASWDVIIVGQGIAGTTLAWHLLAAGQRVLLLDACEDITSSKIAAGLMTPITGQRLKLSWRCDEFLPVARNFYTGIEKQTGQKFFHDRVAIRLFKTDEERQYWSDRARQPAFQAHLPDPQPIPLLDPAVGDASCGGFAMHAAQLDVAAYLEASRTVLDWEEMTLDWQGDVTFGSDEILIGEHRTQRLISCEGYAATRNPYFSWVPFNAAKGDILTVRFHHPVPPRNLHRGIWVAPTADPEVFRVGSTYDWEQLDQVPSTSAREQIENQLKDFIDVPYTVLEHQSAVRPIIIESKPFIGLHPEHERLGFFNGLGSKGSLHAPWFAQCFTDFLVHQTPLPEEFDIGKQF
jgi:glycine/D-amino acid oxidase-like deaminating enzyme